MFQGSLLIAFVGNTFQFVPQSRGASGHTYSVLKNFKDRMPSSSVATVGFCYGSAAIFQGKKAEETKTHKWWVYVRGPNNEDLSGVIKRVLFQLHSSFERPTRGKSFPSLITRQY